VALLTEVAAARGGDDGDRSDGRHGFAGRLRRRAAPAMADSSFGLSTATSWRTLFRY